MSRQTVYVILAKNKPLPGCALPEEHILCARSSLAAAEEKIEFERRDGYEGELRIDRYELEEKEPQPLTIDLFDIFRERNTPPTEVLMEVLSWAVTGSRVLGVSALELAGMVLHMRLKEDNDRRP